jgi:hypothetical protein
MPNSGLRYALLVKGDSQPIIYEQGDIGYHTERNSPWLPPGNVKWAITGMGWIARCMGESAHLAAVSRFIDQIVTELKRANVHKEGSRLTVVSSGLYVHWALEAAQQLQADGISVEVIDLRSIRPMDKTTILRSVEKTRRLLIVPFLIVTVPGHWMRTPPPAPPAPPWPDVPVTFTAAPSPPSAIWIGLFTAAPTDAGGGTEVSGGNYERVQVTHSFYVEPSARW